MNVTLKSGENIALPDHKNISVICDSNMRKITLAVTHSKLTVDELKKHATLKLGAKCLCGKIHTQSFDRMTDEAEAAYNHLLPTAEATKILLEPEPDYDED